MKRERKENKMKKLITMLLAIMLLMTCAPALGEGVVILESPDMPKEDNSGTLDDLKIGVGVDLGDRIYTPLDIKICNFVRSRSGSDFESGNENQIICLWIEALNVSNKPVDFFKDASITVTYEHERGTYKFGGGVRQCSSAEGYRDYPLNYGTPDSIGQLMRRNYFFYCYVPNFVEENPGTITMEITTGGQTMTCVIRK